MDNDTMIKIFPARELIVFDSPQGLTDEDTLEATRVALRLLNIKRKELSEKVKANKEGSLLKEWRSLSKEDKEMILSTRDGPKRTINLKLHKLCEYYGFISFNGASGRWKVTEKYHTLERLLILEG